MLHSGFSLRILLSHRSQILGCRTQKCFSSVCVTNQCNSRHSIKMVSWPFARTVHKCGKWAFARSFSRTEHKFQKYQRMVLRPFSSSAHTFGKYLVGETDRFNARIVNLADAGNRELASDIGQFGAILSDSTIKWQKEGAIAIWLQVPIMHSGLIPTAASHGYELHHTEGDKIFLSKWLLDCPSRLPSYADHQIGVSGFVLNEEKEEVLMIQDKHRIARWKFPGGLSDLGEDIPDTACREVLEETGIRTEFQSILCFRQQHDLPYAFGISDIYIVCRLRPLNLDFNICTDELLEAKWMKVSEVLENPEHTLLSVRVAKLVKYGLQHGFGTVDITMDELPSVYKPATYKLVHKPLSSL